MSDITSTPLPLPIDWSTKSEAAQNHIDKLPQIMSQSSNEVKYIGALVEAYMEEAIPSRKQTASYWEPFLMGESQLTDFFNKWLTYTPTPENPGQYIEFWDYLVNTNAGLLLANDEAFKPWFRKFLNFHGDWINSTSSTDSLADWVKYKGTPDHPFDIDDYECPDPNSPTRGFQSFNQFFLRNLKPDQRPLCGNSSSPKNVVSPCDGGVFYLDRGSNSSDYVPNQTHDLPGKSDSFNLQEALPGFGPYFKGGQLLDILLWFTDYHHFHSPVAGKVIHQGLYEGSYNYDFGDYDPKDFYAPNLPAVSDKVGWYEKLGKHQRYVWIIKTEGLGLVAMVAIGFWGVGSIINALGEGTPTIEKGQYMGHFNYGGSSIVLAFNPEYQVDFQVNQTEVSGPDNPTLMKVRDCLGEG